MSHFDEDKSHKFHILEAFLLGVVIAYIAFTFSGQADKSRPILGVHCPDSAVKKPDEKAQAEDFNKTLDGILKD